MTTRATVLHWDDDGNRLEIGGTEHTDVPTGRGLPGRVPQPGDAVFVAADGDGWVVVGWADPVEDGDPDAGDAA